jgi:hypothetical protein
MKIIAHRGFWKTESEKNTMTALRRAVESGYGFETDFRDCAGEILISHNPPKGDEITADAVFQMYRELRADYPLALNIKADGLQEGMKKLLKKYEIENYFMFDMSVCDTVLYVEQGLTIASRSSEFEPYMPFYKDSKVVWVDYFDGRTNILEEVSKYMAEGKIPCIVSPELHKLPYEEMWKMLKENVQGDYFLCTDYPDKAKEYFSKS